MTREKSVSFVIIASFVFLCLGLFNLQVLQGSKFKVLSDKNYIRLLPQWGARGNILDCHGALLAGNSLHYDVMVLPQEELSQRNQALAAVARALQRDPAALVKAYKANYIGSSFPVRVAAGIDRKQAIAIEELKNDIPSLIIQSRPQRSYPYAKLACHLLGYLNEIDRWRLTKLEDYGYKTKDIVGFGGVEEKYDYYLRQEEGGLSFEVDHRGRFVRTLGFRPPANGKDIQLGLDLEAQKIVEEKIAEKKGCVVIMDPFSGEIRALVSAPGFDPALFGGKSAAPAQRLFDDSATPLIDRVLSAAYPPGSVFKPVVAAAALEEKKINSETAFFCQGSTFVGRQKFDCWSVHGQQNLEQALAHSCNIFFYKTGLMLGGEDLHDYAARFGMGRPAGIDLPYEVAGFIPSPLWRKINRFRNWFAGDTANMSIGQGESLTTPLQIARMMAVFANNGYLVTPYVVKAVGAQDISARQKKIVSLRLKESTIKQVRQGLRQAVIDPKGTANLLSALPVTAAGKTGTAQAPPGRTHGWFAGFFPFEEPKYVICVFLERGGSGAAAASVAKEIIEAMVAKGII